MNSVCTDCGGCRVGGIAPAGARPQEVACLSGRSPEKGRGRRQGFALGRRKMRGRLPALYRQQPSFQFLRDMRCNRLAGEVLRGQAGDELAGHAKEAAESGFAKERAVQIDGMGVKAGEEAKGAADPEHAMQFDPDAHHSQW
jgi:hypothetical protein